MEITRESRAGSRLPLVEENVTVRQEPDLRADSRSATLKFWDSFLQEKNIKWLLVVGILILLGSSLMLVSTHWQDYTPAWKYVVLFAYAVVVFGAGQAAYFRMGLRKTGTVLMALTVLLIPINFFALHWVKTGDSISPRHGVDLALLGLTLAFSWAAARRIFDHFLKGRQPTFVISYLTLCLAGAVAPMLPSAWSGWAALFLWVVFAAGTVKINRHVFWLVEDGGKPRIFGFFPLLLLGAQFLAVFSMHFAGAIRLQWLGLGSVLVALPILLTSDAVARVFQQRTGDLVRPLPWAILLPLGVGLLLCAAGVVFAGVSFVGGDRLALVPTAALAACALAVVARRTSKQAFVWAMLVGVLIAYNFSPVYFTELARRAVQQGAVAVQEQKLPYAFYGLTYVPLLLGLMSASAILRRRGSGLFARPAELLCVGLSGVLLAISVTHVKAILPVAAVMIILFALQAVFFRDRLLAVPALMACCMAAFGFAPFATLVWQVILPADCQVLSLGLTAALLFVLAFWIDPLVRRLPGRAGLSESLCQIASLLLTLGVSAYAMARYVITLEPFAWPATVLMMALLLAHAFRWRQPAVRTVLTAILNWQLLFLTVQVTCPSLTAWDPILVLPACLPVAFFAAASLLCWRLNRFSEAPLASDIAFLHTLILGLLWAGPLYNSLQLPVLAPTAILMTVGTFSLMIIAELVAACRQQQEERVWTAAGVAAAGAAYFAWMRVLVFGSGPSMFIVLALGGLVYTLGRWAQRSPRTSILTKPFQQLSELLPLVAVGLGVLRHSLHPESHWLGTNSLAILLAAGFYFWQGLEQRKKAFVVLSAVILNVASVLLWRELQWSDPQFYMIPVGISVLALVELLRSEIPESKRDPLRYLGALLILVSPTFNIVAGSWLHLFTLMVASVAIILVAMGIRVRALMYTGTAFLLADLATMVVRGSIDNPNVLWIAGLTLGSAVVALGAACENHREVLLQRLRGLSTALQAWD